MFWIQINADEVPVSPDTRDGGGSAAHEGVEHQIAGIGGGKQATFDKGDGLLGGMFAKELLGFTGRGHCPDGFHLFAGHFLHLFVIEEVFALVGLGGPEDGFGGVREIPAGKVRGRVRFLPRDVVENLHAELLHGVADTEDDMVGAGHPDGAVGFQDALATLQPRAVEVVVLLRAP